jgi:hypothetical protein
MSVDVETGRPSADTMPYSIRHLSDKGPCHIDRSNQSSYFNPPASNEGGFSVLNLDFYVIETDDGFLLKVLFPDGSSATLAEYCSREAAFDALRSCIRRPAASGWT